MDQRRFQSPARDKEVTRTRPWSKASGHIYSVCRKPLIGASSRDSLTVRARDENLVLLQDAALRRRPSQQRTTAQPRTPWPVLPNWGQHLQIAPSFWELKPKRTTDCTTPPVWRNQARGPGARPGPAMSCQSPLAQAIWPALGRAGSCNY